MSDRAKGIGAGLAIGLMVAYITHMAVDAFVIEPCDESVAAEKPDIRAYEDTLRGIVCYSATGHPTLSCVRHP